MKKVILLGALIAAVLSVLFAGTALAQEPDVVYPRGDSDPHACTITEWKILPDGSVHGTVDVNATNGFNAGVTEVGKNGEPVLTTFDKEADYDAYWTAKGLQTPPSLKIPSAGQLHAASAGNGHAGLYLNVRYASNSINEHQFIANYSWSDSLVTYYQKCLYSNSWAHQGWSIQSGPNYTPPSIPAANALGTYNTSFTGPGGAYNWLSIRARAYPGWASDSYQFTLAPGCSIAHVEYNGPGWY